MSRKSDAQPNFALIQNEKEFSRVIREISLHPPKAEITIEGLSEIATGKIIEWFPERHFFSVRYSKIPEKFETQTESRSGLRTFFKVHLFSTQLLFKSTTLRRLKDEEDETQIYHYRIPEQIYQQQRRGALRVPLSKNAAFLATQKGNFEILDLSVTGAKLRILEKNAPLRVGSELKSCELHLGKMPVIHKNLQVKITQLDEETCAIRFTKITDQERTQIKQFLIEALRTYYAKELRARS